eukprot:30022-Eustigmatos_ZCMA.PRE.1
MVLMMRIVATMWMMMVVRLVVKVLMGVRMWVVMKDILVLASAGRSVTSPMLAEHTCDHLESIRSIYLS